VEEIEIDIDKSIATTAVEEAHELMSQVATEHLNKEYKKLCEELDREQRTREQLEQEL
jgi:hypothetical protein